MSDINVCLRTIKQLASKGYSPAGTVIEQHAVSWCNKVADGRPMSPSLQNQEKVSTSLRAAGLELEPVRTIKQ